MTCVAYRYVYCYSQMFVGLSLRQQHTWRFCTRRTAKIARCARCSDCFFPQSPRLAYKIWHVRYRRLNLPSVLVPAIFYDHCCESSVRPTHQVGRFYHMTFHCHIAAFGEKNHQVCPHPQSLVAKIACDFRWRSNLPRSAYEIARCVAGFS